MPGEVAVMRAAVDESVSEWAQGERQVHVSPLPGAWDNDTVPVARGIMDIIGAEHVREAFIAGGSQTAKTDITHNFIGWVATHDPGPTMVVMQDRETGIETFDSRLIPMFRDTPSLRKLLTGNPDDLASKRIRIKNGMAIYLAWGKSEGRVASKPIRYVIMSEVDLYPPLTIKKAHARTGAFSGMQKIIEECTVSTEDGRIWSARDQAQALYHYWARCPFCGELQVMDPALVQWKAGVVEPTGLVRDTDVWYLCSGCNHPWDDHDRDQAVRDGEWRMTFNGEPTNKPESVWIHNNPLLSPFNPLRKAATAYLTTLIEPTEENLVFYYNDCCGLPVPEDTEGELPQEKELYRRRENYGPEDAEWQVPMEACYVTADLDFQGNRA
ncbi:MAG: phage terminase large subunit family protein, partial [Geopsychrobacter sp.]|nr:phage terminase large subunit family protein [Geopsychrobacter sp.]